MLMIKALLIGCGNIGAGYDLTEQTKVWSHAKAYALTKTIELSVFDEDREKAKVIADKYNATLLESLSDEQFGNFHIVSITTPTTTHFHYLSKVLTYNVPVVICEKPVVSSIEQAEQLANIYSKATSKILVNYIRRFQPGYENAKIRLQQLNAQQQLKGIIIKYKRGFLNNASHAADLLAFLFGKPFLFKNFHCASATFDAFDYDPTLVGSCIYMDCAVSFIGIADTSFSIFEIELFYKNSKVVICHSGNEIRYYFEKEGSLKEYPDQRQSGLLDTYMLPVIEEAITLLNTQQRKDNFMPSLQLNKEVLQIIEYIKINLNATISN